ncbi:TetR/AcrR family transcriptional regulator [Nocardioides sp. Iso805N]|uniref:TetR/AcrR family transcriptional regulator n=1 Tax=Nocardioides sp. Iso805N TaxID=1283287 RepID=UPI000362932C|nr:TetR/AcrR family transcriptional regulator [Nocardioides sp. Iso805N]
MTSARAQAEPSRPTRQWSRTTETRGAILAAARAVFIEHGFTNANVSDVVQHSGSSVGSIYHHFGGKTELYLALCGEYQDTLHDASTQAVQELRASGERDPLQLFLAGARAYLEQAWTNQDLARVVLSGDHPPDVDAWRRQRSQDWVRENGLLLRVPESAAGRVLVLALTSLIGDAARLISETDSRREAYDVIDATLEMVRKIAG